MTKSVKKLDEEIEEVEKPVEVVEKTKKEKNKKTKKEKDKGNKKKKDIPEYLNLDQDEKGNYLDVPEYIETTSEIPDFIK